MLVRFTANTIFVTTSLITACLTFWVESYQSDLCHFRAMTVAVTLGCKVAGVFVTKILFQMSV